MICDKKYICMSLDSKAIELALRQFQAIVNLAEFAELLFDYCLDCDFNKHIFKTMPGIPQGAFAACKVKEREMKITKIRQMLDSEQEKMFYHGKYLELSPLKYNSKLMNSIWGLYNRYSVHNFKKNTDGGNVLSAGSQQNGVPANKSNSTKSPILVSEWANFWGAHQH